MFFEWKVRKCNYELNSCIWNMYTCTYLFSYILSNMMICLKKSILQTQRMKYFFSSKNHGPQKDENSIKHNLILFLKLYFFSSSKFNNQVHKIPLSKYNKLKYMLQKKRGAKKGINYEEKATGKRRKKKSKGKWDFTHNPFKNFWSSKMTLTCPNKFSP